MKRVGYLSCRICKTHFASTINHLSAEVDVFCEWLVLYERRHGVPAMRVLEVGFSDGGTTPMGEAEQPVDAAQHPPVRTQNCAADKGLGF